VLFNSFEYLLFLPLVLLADALVGRRWRARRMLLLAASYAFYMAWNPPFVALLIGSTGLDFVAARRIHASRAAGSRRGWLLASVAGNLGVLGFFKYGDFFASNLWGALSLDAPHPGLLRDLVLPMGISFYTFQSMSYTIDVYRRVRRPARSLLDLALYVAFFPQLVAGPIVRAGEFLPQLERPRRPSAEDRLAGLDPLFRGLAKKVILADTLGAYVDLVYAAPQDFGAINHWLALYAYAFQIYFDFSGYSDMAIGSARLLGFRIPENFRLPYLARGPADFWRRWHITLSTWLRDYLYVSVGGSRGSRLFTARNLMITMLLGGLWHGAAWGFVVWGAYHGVWLVMHRALCRDRQLLRLPAWLSLALTFHGVCLGWVFFRARSLSDAALVLRQLGDLSQPLVGIEPGVLAALALAFLSHGLGASGSLRRAWNGRGADLRGLGYAAIAAAAYLVGSESTRFIYFQF
jgi:D-alanyl-lipoteichoic acid acyltransferase DltB (MBOAT superfamily)